MSSGRRGSGSRAPKGSGGKGRRKLSGRKPTIPAEERHWYPKKQTKRAPGKDDKDRREPARTSSPWGPRPAPDGSELVIGRNPVVEALRAGIPATTLYVAQGTDADERVREAVKVATDAGVSVLETGRHDLDRRAEGGVHQGLALDVPPYSYVHPNDLLGRAQGSARPALLVALDGVTDPRNLGAIARSAAAFGAHGLLIPGRRTAGVTAAAWKASAGTLARVPVARATNLTRQLNEYQEAGLFVVGLDSGSTTDIDTVELAAGPVVLVVGAEGKGLSRLVAQTCDLVAGIPMTDRAESLNASVAAGVALYAFARLRKG
ncbi:MAG: 23S rRNA (guanosine(2251)-2'-O)-methyltransferase RlmB [Streptosporangiales bacterium]|nr:23S rRNA (guanosine(2251)-2'-O)-methyltransferase RlmB [Streptosporangiales bacterium]